MHKVQIITTPAGEELAVLPRDDYERLVALAEMQADSRTYDAVRGDLAAGLDEMLPAHFADRLMRGENPVRAWREYRGLTIERLAGSTGLDADHLRRIEAGTAAPDGATSAVLAVALGVAAADLEPAAP